MTLEPAHERAPFEIWDAILNIAIISPLSPYPDDDIVDLRLLFVIRCRAKRIQRHVEDTRTRLRLVCRGWDAILQDKGVKMSLNACNNGSAHRYEVFDTFLCACDHCKTRITHSSERRRHIESGAKEFPNLKLFVGMDINRYTIERISGMAPRLQALQYHCVPVFRRVDVWPQRSWIESLTHLELTDVSQTATTVVGKQVTLPRLRALSLKFECGPDVTYSTGFEGKLWLHWWLLPTLKTLKIDGAISALLVHEMDQFLTRPWPNVTSLSLDLTLAEISISRLLIIIPYMIKSSFWTSFPNLRTFGPHATMLAANPPPPPPFYQPFSLVVNRVWNESRMSSTQSLRIALQVLDEWKIITIIFLCLWEDATFALRHEDSRRTARVPPLRYIQRPSPFFAAAIDRNVRLLDIDRAPLSQGNNAELLELIQNWGTDDSNWSIYQRQR